MTTPPLKGGQGRSDESVHEDGQALFVGLGILGCLGCWWLLWWLCV